MSTSMHYILLLFQISVIYDSISWNRVQKIIPFYNEMELERLVVDVSKHRFVKVGTLRSFYRMIMQC